MKNAFQRHATEDRRRVLLMLLREDDAPINEYVLTRALRGFDHVVSELRADLWWLHGQGLAVVDEVEGVLRARITARGDDVAAGRARADGVARPIPGQ